MNIKLNRHTKTNRKISDKDWFGEETRLNKENEAKREIFSWFTIFKVMLQNGEILIVTSRFLQKKLKIHIFATFLFFKNINLVSILEDRCGFYISLFSSKMIIRLYFLVNWPHSLGLIFDVNFTLSMKRLLPIFVNVLLMFAN